MNIVAMLVLVAVSAITLSLVSLLLMFMLVRMGVDVVMRLGGGDFVRMIRLERVQVAQVGVSRRALSMAVPRLMNHKLSVAKEDDRREYAHGGENRRTSGVLSMLENEDVRWAFAFPPYLTGLDPESFGASRLERIVRRFSFS